MFGQNKTALNAKQHEVGKAFMNRRIFRGTRLVAVQQCSHLRDAVGIPLRMVQVVIQNSPGRWDI